MGKRWFWPAMASMALALALLVLSTPNRLTELDILTSAGNAIEEYVPSSYVFEGAEVSRQKVKVNDRVIRSLQVQMMYRDAGDGIQRVYTVYLQPQTGQVVGFGEVQASALPSPALQP